MFVMLPIMPYIIHCILFYIVFYFTSATVNHVVLPSGHRHGYDFRDNDQVDHSASGQYSTHLFTDRATKIINQHNTSQPLFLYLAHQAAHAPLQVATVPVYCISSCRGKPPGQTG